MIDIQRFLHQFKCKRNQSKEEKCQIRGRWHEEEETVRTIHYDAHCFFLMFNGNRSDLVSNVSFSRQFIHFLDMFLNIIIINYISFQPQQNDFGAKVNAAKKNDGWNTEHELKLRVVSLYKEFFFSLCHCYNECRCLFHHFIFFRSLQNSMNNKKIKTSASISVRLFQN